MKDQIADIVVAGHICLDVTPAFPDTKIEKFDDMFIPGGLVQMGSVDIHVGGSVSNTGLGLNRLGAKVSLMGKIGDDDFGRIFLNQISQYTSTDEMIVGKGENTSYSVVLAPKGIDRIFLHHSGANDSFCSSDINYSIIKNARIFHFGYPPLMKKLYQNTGEDLIKIFKKVKSLGVATSLDMASIDENSEAGKINWEEIIKKLLPYLDFFVPSIEELAYMVDRPRYNEWVERAAGKDITSILSIEDDVAPIAEKLISWGAKVLLIKCGAPGLYFATADENVLANIGGGLNKYLSSWINIRHFEYSFKPDKILSGTGAGDTTIAAFLYSLISGYSWNECLQFATATGACCVEAYDALSGLKPFSYLKEKINNGWEKQYLIK